MRARLEGNHSTRKHCGCTAVWNSLERLATQNGWRVVTGDDFDALIVNGEGSMHHSSSTWHRKMQMLAKAVDAGKPAYLVNTVWQENGADYDRILRRLSGVWVREVESQRDLRERHGVDASVSPDISIFHRPRPWLGVRDFRGAAVMTDFWCDEFRNFAFPRTDGLEGMKQITMAGRWGAFVASLKTAAFLATGRHHAVYAAIVARTPFAAMEGNTHKIAGIMKTAGVNIPVARNLAELPDVIRSIDCNRGEYEKLFNWMAARSPEAALPRPPEGGREFPGRAARSLAAKL